MGFGNKHGVYLCLFYVIITILFGNSSNFQNVQLNVVFHPSKEMTTKMIATTEIRYCSNEKQYGNFQLDFNSGLLLSTYMKDTNQDNEQSKSKNTFDITYLGHKLAVYREKTQLAMSGKEIKIVFNVLENGSNGIFEETDGVLGLGYLFKDSDEKEYSFIHQLLKKQLISYEIFSFNFVGDTEADLYIGEYLPKIVNDYKNYGFCDLIYYDSNRDVNPNWECEIKEVILKGHNAISENVGALFSLTTKSISPPYKLREKIWDTFSQDEQFKNVCRKEGINKEIGSIICNKTNKINSELFISFHKWNISVPYISLLKENEETVIFHFTEGNNQWILGFNFLRYFTLVFDKHHQKMGFYNSDWLIHEGNEVLQKPFLSNEMEVSLKPTKVDTAIKSMNYSVLFIFNIFMAITFGTVVLVILYLILDYLKKVNNNDNVVPFYSKGTSEIFDISSYTSK